MTKLLGVTSTDFFLIEFEEYVLRNVPARLRSNADTPPGPEPGDPLGLLGMLSLSPLSFDTLGLYFDVTVAAEDVDEVMVELRVVLDLAAGEDGS